MLTMSAISDAFKSLLQSLQVTSSLPSIVFVVVNAYYVAPRLWPDLDTTYAPFVVIVIAFILMFSYMLYAFNFPLIRFIEGYKIGRTDIGRFLSGLQQSQYNTLARRIGRLQEARAIFKEALGGDPDEDDRLLSKSVAEKWRKLNVALAQAERKMDTQFPPDRLLPTQFGNSIAAFEDYPRSRYGMDAIALWSRLVPLLKEKNYSEFVVQEKTVLDFLLNTAVIVSLLGIELFYLNLYWSNFAEAVIIAGSSVLVLYLLYEAMIVAARQWGTTVRVAFDLFRYDLRARLRIIPAETPGDELRRWRSVSRFLLYRRSKVTLEDFFSQAEVAQKERAEAK